MDFTFCSYTPNHTEFEPKIWCLVQNFNHLMLKGVYDQLAVFHCDNTGWIVTGYSSAYVLKQPNKPYVKKDGFELWSNDNSFLTMGNCFLFFPKHFQPHFMLFVNERSWLNCHHFKLRLFYGNWVNYDNWINSFHWWRLSDAVESSGKHQVSGPLFKIIMSNRKVFHFVLCIFHVYNCM